MQGDNDVISSCHIYASCFSAIVWGKLCKMFVIVTSLSNDNDNTTIILNHLIQFHSNNAKNLHHLTSHSTPYLLPHNIEIVLYPQITVTSLHPAPPYPLQDFKALYKCCIVVMVALCNRATIIFLPCGFYLSSFFFSSPNLSGRRLDVYHTSTHGVALLRI